MKISENLRLIVPIYENEIDPAEKEEDQAPPIGYAHSAPVSRAAFEGSCELIMATNASIQSLGQYATKEAALIMRKAAERLRLVKEGEEPALMMEIRRLTNVVLPTASGWEPRTFQEVVDGKLLSEDDIREVMNAITFFTVGWHVMPRRARVVYLTDVMPIWGARLTSSTLMEFAASLPTSIAAGNSGEKSATTSQQPEANIPDRGSRRGISLRAAAPPTASGGVVAATLSWLADEGLGEFFEDIVARYDLDPKDWAFADAADFRNRHMTKLVIAMMKAREGL